jgi:hypothetical protein
MLLFLILALLGVAAAMHVIVASIGRPGNSRTSPLLLVAGYVLVGVALAVSFAGRRSSDAPVSLSAAALQQRTNICRKAGVADNRCATDSVTLSRAMLALIDRQRAADAASDADASTAAGQARDKSAAQAALRRQLSYAGYGVDVQATTMRLYQGRLPVACGNAFAKIEAPEAGTVFGRNTRFVVFSEQFLWVEMLASPGDFEPVWRAFCA